MSDRAMPPWSKRQEAEVRVLLFGWPLWTADPERAEEAFDKMPTVDPHDAEVTGRTVHHWRETGIPQGRVLAYIQAGVSLPEALAYEDDPRVDTTTPEFAGGMHLLAALQPPRPIEERDMSLGRPTRGPRKKTSS